MKDYEKLETIPLDVDADGLARIIRATFTEKFPPKIKMLGYKFYLKSPTRNF
jgi:hypothetical protein